MIGWLLGGLLVGSALSSRTVVVSQTFVRDMGKQKKYKETVDTIAPYKAIAGGRPCRIGEW